MRKRQRKKNATEKRWQRMEKWNREGVGAARKLVIVPSWWDGRLWRIGGEPPAIRLRR